jgi:hypothetical protein
MESFMTLAKQLNGIRGYQTPPAASGFDLHQGSTWPIPGHS